MGIETGAGRDGYVDFSRPSLGTQEIGEVVAALESGWLSTGPRVRDFERRFAEFVGAPHALAVSSCTAALHLALLAAGVGPGDEVITTPLTFCATANAILQTGAIPVFADVDPATMNLDPAAAAAAVTPRTKALLPVHYGGRPADVVALRAVADRHGLALIEDAAHCVDGAVNGRRVGSIGDFTCFSFYATKNLTTGEGGMVTTASGQADEWMRVASLHGMSKDAWSRYSRAGGRLYDVVMCGFKYNMMDIQAALGLKQLERLPEMQARRRALWERYDEGLADLPLARPAAPAPGTVHARHLYAVLVDASRTGCSRDDLRQSLQERGIGTSVHFTALHLFTYYAQRLGLRRGQFPAAEYISDHTLSLPFSPALSDEEADRVVDNVRELVGRPRA
jgi:dTDP-4-amino-4,6-dideoxygalactose transaminase